jgi:chitin disaccharide deacetylase
MKPIFLIINADDYGYFPCVSQGILDAAKSYSLTATGVLANASSLSTQLAALRTVPHLQIGIHLNLTFQQPLTEAMREKQMRIP